MHHILPYEASYWSSLALLVSLAFHTHRLWWKARLKGGEVAMMRDVWKAMEVRTSKEVRTFICGRPPPAYSLLCQQIIQSFQIIILSPITFRIVRL